MTRRSWATMHGQRHDYWITGQHVAFEPHHTLVYQWIVWWERVDGMPPYGRTALGSFETREAADAAIMAQERFQAQAERGGR